MDEIIKYYLLFTSFYSTIILVSVLLGIEVEIKPFKYSLVNILDKIEKNKQIKSKKRI